MSFDKLTQIERNTRFTNDSVKRLTSSSSLIYSDYQKLLNEANDLETQLTYLDPTDPVLRRVSVITYSSIALGLTVTETFSYAVDLGGNYYVTNIQLA